MPTKHDCKTVESEVTPEMIEAELSDAPEPTSEMINAGVRALYAYDNDPMFASPEERVDRIFRAMMAARSTATGKISDLPSRIER